MLQTNYLNRRSTQAGQKELPCCKYCILYILCTVQYTVRFNCFTVQYALYIVRFNCFILCCLAVSLINKYKSKVSLHSVHIPITTVFVCKAAKNETFLEVIAVPRRTCLQCFREFIKYLISPLQRLANIRVLIYKR